MNVGGVSVDGNFFDEEFAFFDSLFLFAESEFVIGLLREYVVNEPVETLSDGSEDGIKVTRSLVVFSDVLSEESGAVERDFVLKEDFSGLVSELLPSVIAVVSENDALETFDVFEYLLPEFTEIAAVRSEDAVAFLIESEPVEDAFSDDDGIVLFALEGVKAEGSVSEEGIVSEACVLVFRLCFVLTCVISPSVTASNVVKDVFLSFVPEGEDDSELVAGRVNADFELSNGVVSNAPAVKVVESADAMRS